MTTDIRTSVLEPTRQTYRHVRDRQTGAPRPASRYDEATMDVQPRENFHYRPMWASEFELFDERRTKIRMKDWYALRDPRQYYYATYNLARNAMQESADSLLAFAQRNSMVEGLSSGIQSCLLECVLPLRHYEWGANMNACNVADYGFGTAISQAGMFAAADRIGIAQILTRIGLLIDGQTGSSLDTAKACWMSDARLQPTRKMVEDSFVLGDWFETLVAQNVAMDGIIYPLVYVEFAKRAPGSLALLFEFMTRWFADSSRWIDSIVKVAAAESSENRTQLSAWFHDWATRAEAAAAPLAASLVPEDPDISRRLARSLDERFAKLGLDILGSSANGR